MDDRGTDSQCACYCCRLSLHRSGGQCLDEAGARVRRWSWDSLSLTPTALQPVFLSLNKSVGIRVLGIEQVFVTFLAQGQQAKFSVGTCCAQVKSEAVFIFPDHIFTLQFPALQYKLCTKFLFLKNFCRYLYVQF